MANTTEHTDEQSGNDFGPGLLLPLMPDTEQDVQKEQTSGKKPGKLGANDMTGEEKDLKESDCIPKTMKEVKRILEEKTGLNASFDLLLREMNIGGRGIGLFYANGLAKDTVLTNILIRLTMLTREELEEHTLDMLMYRYMPHIQVEKVKSMNEAVDKVLAGGTAFFVEGESKAILVDAKNFPVHSVNEPDLERVVRGARDGFVETMLTNVSLVRRRIRDPRLKLETMQVGERTKTDVCLAYIQDISDPTLVEAIRDRIQKVEIDGLPLADKQLEEALIEKGWNPYPMVRYSERPDVVAAHLIEGHVCLFVDTSPSVMIMPTTMFHLLQHAEEYRNTPFIGTYMRWVRYAGVWASIFLLPLWYLIISTPGMKPAGLEWLGPDKSSHLPIILQFFFAELGVDLMRLAAVHTPQPLATAMGLVAAVMIGDIAVKTGMFVNEVILYMAVATVGLFATPSYELAMANRISRLVMLAVTAVFSVPGFIIAATLWVLFLGLQRSYNTPYLWPFIPFDAKAFFTVIVRKPFMRNKKRMSLIKPIDRTRQPT